MSERSYFSYRWAIPGYTFILLIITINYHVLLISIKEQPEVPIFFQLFLGFLTLLSGSGIGFLISQIWHSIHDYFCLYYGVRAPRAPYLTTINLYGLEKGYESKEDKKRIRSFYLYLLNSYPKSKEIEDLLSRRGDLYHLFGSEICSMLLGLLIGIFIRLLSHCCLDKKLIFIDQIWWKTSEFWILLVTFSFTIFFIIILCIRMRAVNKQFNLIADPLIRSIYNNVKKIQLYEVFPRKYFSWPLFELKIPIKYEVTLKTAGIDTIYKLSKYDSKKDPKKIIKKHKDIREYFQKAKIFLDEYETSHTTGRD